MAKFSTGTLIVTPRVQQLLEATGSSVDDLLARHRAGDWGQVTDEQWALNELALEQHLHLMSTYVTPGGEWVTVFTRNDRSFTLVHLAPPHAAAATEAHPAIVGAPSP